MNRRGLAWQIAIRYGVVCLLALASLAWLAVMTFDRTLVRATWSDLDATVSLVASQVAADLAADHPSNASQVAKKIAEATDTRITLVAPDGKVLFDSRGEADPASNLATVPEIAAAMAGEGGRAARYSPKHSEEVMYSAAAVRQNSKLLGAARVAKPAVAIERAHSAALQSLALWGAVIGGAALLIGWRLVGNSVEPLQQIELQAQRLAAGQSAGKLPLADASDLASLASSLNTIALQLEERSMRIGRQGHEQAAILASMTEGVLAVDSDERIIAINSAASELIGAHQIDLQGRKLPEVLRNADLRRFVSRALGSPDPIEDDVVLHGDLPSGGSRILQVRGAALRDGSTRGIGAVIVLNDVTQYRKLENLRRDFVANVSHELKTPIASIKGFVETLLDGAMQDPADAQRFLKIIANHAERLHNIVEDLLSLSKIEQSEEAANLPMETRPLRPVLDAAVVGCHEKAAQREIGVVVECDPNLIADVNPLLEQAVINLIDNAIKYSEPGKQVSVSAKADVHDIVISVSDRGCGISQEHLPRLFERFYRVDRARSRKLGGTGLGLAIVKHIVQAHRGRVSVESTPGEGSMFSIHLPLPVSASAQVSATKA